MSAIFHSPRPIAVLGGLCAVTACAVPPPSGPTVMALPLQGKSLTVFQQEDEQCRAHAAAAIQPGPAGAQAADKAAISRFDLQTGYNIAYAQCMYAFGNTVTNPPVDFAFGNPWSGYPSSYGYPGDDWVSPGFFGGGIFIGPGRVHHFHRFHHFHEGFHGGFHGGAFHEGFHGGGHFHH